MSDPVMVALIASLIGPGALTVLNRWGTKRELERRVGTPNGKGNLVEMCESILAGQAGQDNRLARIESRQMDHESRIRAIEARASIKGDS